MMIDHGIHQFFDQVDDLPSQCCARDRDDSLSAWIVENFGPEIADAIVERVGAEVL